MTALLVIANITAAAFILGALFAVMRLGHRLGHGHHDHRLLSLPRRETAAAAEREAA